MSPLAEMTEREYFASVGQRPGMFVGKPSLHMPTAFLTGYDQHALRHGGTGSPAGTTGSSPVGDMTAATPGPARFSMTPSRTAGTTP
ncbi:hypothetical protein ACIRQF_10535 [Streptomyces sp. NPDC101191]|uniref:hypothetical protein n=1 Tax=Streptomyces sp. NPDC101191 TaxID=3366126 RepID=UPI0037FFB6F0